MEQHFSTAKSRITAFKLSLTVSDSSVRQLKLITIVLLAAFCWRHAAVRYPLGGSEEPLPLPIPQRRYQCRLHAGTSTD